MRKSGQPMLSMITLAWPSGVPAVALAGVMSQSVHQNAPAVHGLRFGACASAAISAAFGSTGNSDGS